MVNAVDLSNKVGSVLFAHAKAGFILERQAMLASEDVLAYIGVHHDRLLPLSVV